MPHRRPLLHPDVSSPISALRSSWRLVIVPVVMAACMFAAYTGGGQAATAGSVVGATVLSSSWIDASACATGTPGVTEFGTVTAGSSNVTTGDCTVAFGSSNDTSMLRLAQSNQVAPAMWQHAGSTLDTTFDGDGYASNGVGDWFNDAAVQPDGKVVAVGWRDVSAFEDDILVQRFNVDGTIDTTFDGDSGNGNGIVTFDPGGWDRGLSVTVQPDGRILVGADAAVPGGSQMWISRLNANGTLDTTFDGPSGSANGAFLIDATQTGGAEDSTADDIDLLADGRILVTGTTYEILDFSHDFGAVLLRADGSIDPTFGGGDGIQRTSMGTYFDIVGETAVLANGDFATAGYRDDAGNNNEWAIARFNSDGTLDPGFGGGDGKVWFDVGLAGADNEATGIVEAPDGDLLVSGWGWFDTGGWNHQSAVARLQPDGSFDTSFDGDSGSGNGVVVVSAGATPTESDEALSVASQLDGRILLGSDAATDAPLTRMFADGRLDTTFDGDGIMRLGNELASIELFDGDVVAAGPSGVVRLAGIDVPDYAFGSNDWDQGNGTFGACLRAVANGASAVWTVDATCTMSDGAWWNPISTSPTGSKVASTAIPDAQGGADPAVSLRFGLRTGAAQAAGRYFAPITFTTVAPNI